MVCRAHIYVLECHQHLLLCSMTGKVYRGAKQLAGKAGDPSSLICLYIRINFITNLYMYISLNVNR